MICNSTLKFNRKLSKDFTVTDWSESSNQFLKKSISRETMNDQNESSSNWVLQRMTHPESAKVGTLVGLTGGSLAGISAGGFLGTMFIPIGGTLIGAIFGGICGGIAVGLGGAIIGSEIGHIVSENDEVIVIKDSYGGKPTKWHIKSH
jgi:hypothetical protein